VQEAKVGKSPKLDFQDLKFSKIFQSMHTSSNEFSYEGLISP